MLDYNKLSNYIDNISEKQIEQWFAKFDRKYQIEQIQLNRFHKIYSETEQFHKVVTKIQHKYNSEDYINRWLSRYIEPEESLYWFLFKYATEYGRECTNEEYDLYANEFTSKIYFVNGYYFQKINGQGSSVQIDKVKN